SAHANDAASTTTDARRKGRMTNSSRRNRPAAATRKGDIRTMASSTRGSDAVWEPCFEQRELQDAYLDTADFFAFSRPLGVHCTHATSFVAGGNGRRRRAMRARANAAVGTARSAPGKGYKGGPPGESFPRQRRGGGCPDEPNASPHPWA